MKTFKQFLLETKFKSYRDHDFETEGFSHTHTIGGHTIEHRFVKSPIDNDHYSYEYDVNGHMSSEDSKVKSSTTKAHIAMGAAKVLNDFVAHKKPGQLSFSAFTPSHDPYFHKVASALAVKHGYDHKIIKNPLWSGPNHILKRPE